MAAWWRRRLWRTAFAAAAHGVAVTGRIPAGGCVVVTNHSSHADIAALLAALPAGSAPVVAAAADHWFSTPLRSAVCRSLTGGRPVRRGGGGWDDLVQLAAFLRQGRVVVVFPEGTRTRDGSLADFRSGAFRLAAHAGVPVVPAAIVGSADVLPIDEQARVHRAPCEVRFGDALTVDDDTAPARARSAVVALLEQGPARRARARSHRWAAALAGSGLGLILAFVWAAAEAVSWPLMAELFLMLVLPAAPRRWWRLALALAAGSVTGVLACALLARHGILLPAPWTTPLMQTTVAAQVTDEGARALWHQPLNGIPVKVYAREAGAVGVPLPDLALWAALARTLRIALVAAAIAALAHLWRRWLRSGYGVYLPALLVTFGLALERVVRGWR